MLAGEPISFLVTSSTRPTWKHSSWSQVECAWHLQFWLTSTKIWCDFYRKRKPSKLEAFPACYEAELIWPAELAQTSSQFNKNKRFLSSLSQLSFCQQKRLNDTSPFPSFSLPAWTFNTWDGDGTCDINCLLRPGMFRFCLSVCVYFESSPCRYYSSLWPIM